MKQYTPSRASTTPGKRRARVIEERALSFVSGGLGARIDDNGAC